VGQGPAQTSTRTRGTDECCYRAPRHLGGGGGGSAPTPGAEFDRYGGHTSCVAIAHDGSVRASLSTPAPVSAGRATFSETVPVFSTPSPTPGRSCSATCTGSTPRGSRSSPAATTPAPGSISKLPPKGRHRERPRAVHDFPTSRSHRRAWRARGASTPTIRVDRHLGLFGPGARDQAQSRTSLRPLDLRRENDDQLRHLRVRKVSVTIKR
jgi:hypothetical protein